jgi:hypothetical protein
MQATRKTLYHVLSDRNSAKDQTYSYSVAPIDRTVRRSLEQAASKAKTRQIAPLPVCCQPFYYLPGVLPGPKTSTATRQATDDCVSRNRPQTSYTAATGSLGKAIWSLPGAERSPKMVLFGTMSTPAHRRLTLLHTPSTSLKPTQSAKYPTTQTASLQKRSLPSLAWVWLYSV